MMAFHSQSYICYVSGCICYVSGLRKEFVSCLSSEHHRHRNFSQCMNILLIDDNFNFTDDQLFASEVLNMKSYSLGTEGCQAQRPR